AKLAGRQREDQTGYSEERWQQMAEMGVLGIVADPDLGMIDRALILEEMGRNAYAGPFFPTAVLAASALAAAGESTLLSQIGAGEVKGTAALLGEAGSWQPSAGPMGAVRPGGSVGLYRSKRLVAWAAS